MANAKFKSGIRIEKNAYAEVPNFGDFEHNQAFSLSAWVRPSNNQLSGAVIGKMDESNKFRGYDLWFEGGRPRHAHYSCLAKQLPTKWSLKNS